jgi:transcription initiation factor TFIIH subunit 2
MSTPAGTVVAAAKLSADGKGTAHSWEDTNDGQLWERAVQEDADGRIVLGDRDEALCETIRKRRRRLEQNDYSQRHRRVVRDMIRYVYVLIDASRWVRTKDPMLQPGQRLDVMVQMCIDFVSEFYDQNPLSHLGFVLIKNGEAEILTQLSGSAKFHKVALQSVLQICASENGMGGEFSLQNGLEVAGRSLGHQPRHGSREIVILTAALSTCDPGYILTETLPKLLTAKIRVSCFALTAELYICRKLAEETSGTMGVCLDKGHFRDWLFGQTVPPPASSTDEILGCEMIHMGFPTRTTSSEVAVLVHATREKTLLAHTAYTCPQCQAKNYELPTDCAVCGLKLVLAPHLARSFHHLFPVQPFLEPNKIISTNASISQGISKITSSTVPMVTSTTISTILTTIDSSILVTSKDNDVCCFACLQPMNVAALQATIGGTGSGTGSNNNRNDELLRFQCPECHNFFCVDCDAFLHESLHNCPGCLCLPG